MSGALKEESDDERMHIDQIAPKRKGKSAAQDMFKNISYDNGIYDVKDAAKDKGKGLTRSFSYDVKYSKLTRRCHSTAVDKEIVDTYDAGDFVETNNAKIFHGCSIYASFDSNNITSFEVYSGDQGKVTSFEYLALDGEIWRLRRSWACFPI